MAPARQRRYAPSWVCGRRAAGRITFDDQSINGMDTPDIAQLGIAYVPEYMGILGKLTVRENMLLATGAQGFAKDSLDRVLAWFPPIKLKWDSAAGLLSGGQKQMLAIARAVVEQRRRAERRARRCRRTPPTSSSPSARRRRRR